VVGPIRGWAHLIRRRWPFLLTIALVAAALAAPAAISFAAAGGNNNKGDVWLDNTATVGLDTAACSAPTDITTKAENCESPGDGGPGHSHDPHLACRNIDLWGDKLVDPEGIFTIDGWPPSGSMGQSWPGTVALPGTAGWVYSGVADADSSGQGSSTNDVIATIDVGVLIAHAIANGDAPVNKQGFHFKLQFSQDPQKHKTFWVDCPGPGGGDASPSPNPSSSPGPVSSPSPEASPSPDGSPSPSSSPSPVSSPSPDASPSPSPNSSPSPGASPSPVSSPSPSSNPSPAASPSASPAGAVLGASTTAGLPFTGTGPGLGDGPLGLFLAAVSIASVGFLAYYAASLRRRT
jgi:hypothetical protein